MRRKLEKPKKVRVNICLDKDVYEESGEFIYNLSAFVNKCIKKQIELEKSKFEKEIATYNDRYVQKVRKEKTFAESCSERLDPSTKWWED